MEAGALPLPKGEKGSCRSSSSVDHKGLGGRTERRRRWLLKSKGRRRRVVIRTLRERQRRCVLAEVTLALH